ncbi:MAG: fumarate reductase/succinate dehydrogenase flavoprotein subunit [Candidatus Thorarchaeota archaeon]
MFEINMQDELDNLERFHHDILIIGAGGAGLRAAIGAAEKKLSVGVVCKSLLGKAHTVMAEGGIAAALGDADPNDNWKIHFRDTMRGGKLHSDWRMARLHGQLAPQRVKELEKWGAVFDRTKTGKISQRHFGGHTFQRLAHVGDRTGLEIIRTLQNKVIHQKNIKIYMECTVTQIIVEEGKVVGVFGYNRQDGKLMLFEVNAAIIATGGMGKCYRVTSNSWEYTGDGFGLAYDAGAELVDMEFVQFHPTGMLFPSSVAGILVTEGVRGEGGVLVNNKGERFMFNYIPKFFKDDYADTEEEAERWGMGDNSARRPPELLTRDVVARAIMSEVKAGRGSPHGGVFLDIASRKSREEILKKLPSMHHQFLTLAQLDITKEPMEVGPTCHYFMGGIRVDPFTQKTSITGLYAAGEAASGLHGANRLGGNSLSDLLVFGALAGEAAAEYTSSITKESTVSKTRLMEAINQILMYFDPNRTEDPYKLHDELKDIMEEHIGIARSEENIKAGINKLEEISKKINNVGVLEGGRKYNPNWHLCIDLHHMLITSITIARGALERKESRGAHTRVDYPESNPDLTDLLIVLKKADDGTLEVAHEKYPQVSDDLKELIEQEV